MYIPELDALVFLATEFLEGTTNQPSLHNGIEALQQASGTFLKHLLSLCAVRPAHTLAADWPVTCRHGIRFAGGKTCQILKQLKSRILPRLAAAVGY